MSTIRHFINVGFLAALCVSLGLVCGHVTPSLRFQLVGFTSQPMTGDAGALAFTTACQAEFTGSRLCTSEEVLATVAVPAGLSGDAWVHPVYKPLAGELTSYTVVLDASGRMRHYPGTSGSLSCLGWSEAPGVVFDNLGLTVRANGGFDVGECDVERPVSCCAAVP